MGWLTEAGIVAAALAAFLAAAGVIAKSPIGRCARWMYRRLFGEPATDFGRRFVAETVTPQIDDVKAQVVALDEKNDRQHSENAHAIALLTRGVEHVRQSLVEHRTEINDHLAEFRRTLADHLTDADRRDDRITALEGLANVKVVIEPITGEQPATEPPGEAE